MTKSEAQTRSELIDQQLAPAGWDVKDPTQVIEEFDILTALSDRNPLTQESINTSIAGRDYQIRAIRAVLEGIEQKKTRLPRVVVVGDRELTPTYCPCIPDSLFRPGCSLTPNK